MERNNQDGAAMQRQLEALLVKSLMPDWDTEQNFQAIEAKLAAIKSAEEEGTPMPPFEVIDPREPFNPDGLESGAEELYWMRFFEERDERLFSGGAPVIEAPQPALNGAAHPAAQAVSNGQARKSSFIKEVVVPMYRRCADAVASYMLHQSLGFYVKTSLVIFICTLGACRTVAVIEYRQQVKRVAAAARPQTPQERAEEARYLALDAEYEAEQQRYLADRPLHEQISHNLTRWGNEHGSEIAVFLGRKEEFDAQDWDAMISGRKKYLDDWDKARKKKAQESGPKPPPPPK